MKTIQEKITGLMMVGGSPAVSRFAPWLILTVCFALAGQPARAQTKFANAAVIVGDWGVTNVDNTGVVPDANAPSVAGQVPQHTVWFKWLATASGEVTFDTFGSVDDVTGTFQLDTVLGIFTGNNLATLSLVAANDNLDAFPQINVSGQNVYTFGATNFNVGTTNPPAFSPSGGLYDVFSPFSGPSGIRFNAVAGTTYYIAVDTKGLTGYVSLNWALHPSGVFRFATENSDGTGLTYSNGTPMLMYQGAATESVSIKPPGKRDLNVLGIMVTITRVAGSSGRALVSYTTADIGTNSSLLGTNGFLINGDLPAAAGTDYIARSGTLVFNNFEMSKTIVIPVISSTKYRPNRDFTVMITNAVLDPLESSDVSAPRVDTVYSSALVRILDVNVDPRGVSSFSVTNVPPGNTNATIVYSPIPTNAVFNFQKAYYQVLRYGSNATITLYVNRTGTNAAASPTIYYAVNSSYPYDKNAYPINHDNDFPLQPGSDYATPDPIDTTPIKEKIPDFILPGGYSGTLSWGANDFQPKPIQIKLYNNNLQQFNEDFQIDLYALDSNGNPLQVGMVNQCSVTIANATDILAATVPSAGSVDEFYNADYGSDFWITTTPPNMAHPGTDGQVYGLALQPDGNTIVVGDFFSYDQTARNCIARATSSGYLDTTFNPGSGANDFISCVTLNSSNQVIIGGAFTSFNGTQQNHIARLNTNGSLDTNFTAGAGANGTIWAVNQLSDGTILIAGDFTNYNGVVRNHIALLNSNGTLNANFNPGTAINGSVYTLGIQTNGIIIGGTFTSLGGVAGQNYLGRLSYSGAVDTTFNQGAIPNGAVETVALQPDGNVVIGGDFTGVGTYSFNGISRVTSGGVIDTNFYCGLGVDGSVYSLTVQTNPVYSTSNPNLVVQTNFTIYVGGSFTEFNGTHRLGFARLNADGTVDTTFLDTAYNQFAGLTREYYNDPLGAVLASAVQPDGNVLIGGSFDQVGGGDFDAAVRPDSYFNTVQYLYGGYYDYRQSIRSHSNIARLVGGGTPGPGNVGLANNYTYSAGKSSGSYNVLMVRTNGFLGMASANCALLPGLAQSGLDYEYVSTTPTYISAWDSTRMHSDGVFGNSFVYSDEYNTAYAGSIPGAVTITLTGNESNPGDLNATLQLANPAQQDEFYLGGENIPLGVALGQSSAPFTLIEDHQNSGTFGFSSAQYTTNGPNTAAISVVRTNGTYGTVKLNYTTTTNGSTAILNSDYRASSGIITFGSNPQSFPVQVLVTNSTLPIEKRVNLLLFNPQGPVNGVVAMGLTNAVLRVINPNFQGYLDFSTNNFYTSLSSGYAPVTVTRTVGSKGTLSVQLVTANGPSATNGVDYLTTITNLQWASGDTSSRTVLIPLLNQGDTGWVRQFNVSLVNPTLNTTSAPALLLNSNNPALVTISNDNSYGVFQFSAPTYTVNENGGTATLTIIRTGSSLGYANVNYTTIDGSATDENNYYGDSGTLYFDPGEVAQTIQIDLIDDGIVDNLDPAQFYFQVQLSSPSTGAYLGSPTNANVRIVDAEAYNRPPGSPDSTFNDGVGMNGTVFALAQQSDGQLIAGGAFTTVNNVPENYFARLNVDGSLDSSGFLSGLSGANAPIYSLIDQTDDRVVLGGNFTTVDGVVRNRIARVMTDGSVDTSFNPGSGADGTIYSLAETFIGGNRGIYLAGAFQNINSVNRQYLARLNNNGTVDTSFSPGSGPNGVVYAVAAYPTNSPFAGKVLIGGAFTNVNNFPAAYIARLNANGSVDTNFDAGLGVDGVVRAIAIQSDGGIVIGGDFQNAFDSYNPGDTYASSHLARIYDDGTGYSYVDSDFAFNVGGVSGPNGSVYALAVQADDNIVVAGNFTHANGVTRNNVTRLNSDGTSDNTINFGLGANGSVYAALVQSSDQMIVLGGSFTSFNRLAYNNIVRIYGGSLIGPGAFSFTASNFNAPENGVNALVMIQRTGGTSSAESVDLNITDNTATSGVNYSNNTPLTVNFPAGEVLETVSVPLVDDGIITPDLTANMALSNPQSESESDTPSLGDQPTATLTIQNVDSAVAFSSGSYFVAKNVATGLANIDVLRLGSTIGMATVSFVTTTNGSALIGTDFYPTNVTVTFAPGQSDQLVQIPIINNNVPEGLRTVTFMLSNALNTLLSPLYQPTNATLNIQDSVYAPGTLVLLTNSIVVNGSSAFAYITVIRTNGSSGPVSVSYSTTANTAIPGIDYLNVSNVLNFADTVTNATIAVPLVNNNLVQLPVTFTANLFGAAGGATLSSPTNALVTILCNNAGIAFAAVTNSAPENSGSVSLIVQRINNTNGVSTVNYATADGVGSGAALFNVNYTATSGQLTFTNGESLKSITVPLLYDTNVTGDLTFGVNLTSPVGAQLVAPSNSVVVVQDADAGLSFTTNSQQVLKNSGVATITVVCSNPRVEPVITSTNIVPLQVNYTTVNGTALAGTDYQGTSGTLVFTNGNATNTFSVQIYNNSSVTGDKAFSIVLSSPTAPGQITPYGTQAVVIAESNTGLSFSQSNYKVFKNGIAATITVTRTGYTNSAASVSYLATNGTAINGVNFTATNGTLNFTNGVVSQTFNVPLIANSQVQPNLAVLLQLSNPTNALLVTPSAATLTILENGGSYVIPAGAQMVTNYSSLYNYTNGIIGSNDTVQILFALRDSAGLDVTNLNAYLLPINGIVPVAPFPSSTNQNYGPLKVYDHSVSRPFIFKANGTNSFSISPTFALYDNTKFIGTAVFNYSIGTWTTTFSNTAAIIINDFTTASPYPSAINVSGVGGTLIKAAVTFTNLSHTSPADIDALVTSPAQKNTLLMHLEGGQNAVNHITITFDDTATNALPRNSVITNGVYKPTSFGTPNPFP